MLFVNTVPDELIRKEKFNMIYHGYYRYVYKIAYNMLKNDELTQDTVQEIFMNIWKGLDSIKLEDEEGTKAFISVVAKNTSINKYNKLKKISPNVADIDDDVLYATVSDRSADPLDVVANDESINYIYGQIEQLGETYSKVMLLMYKYECTPEEIADILNMNIKTVYTKLSRGRQLLKSKLYDNERRINNEKVNK